MTGVQTCALPILRRLPFSPNHMVRRLAISSADSSTDVYLSSAASTAACTDASIEVTSWALQSMELRGKGGIWLEFGNSRGNFLVGILGILRGGIDWL